MRRLGRPAARTLLGAAAAIAAVTAVARVVGFGRVAVFSRAVGPTCVGDTYALANAVPNVVFEVVAGGALASMVVPVLAGAVQAGDRATASRTTSALLTWTVAVLVPVALLGALAAPLLMRALVGGDPACDGAVDVGARMLVVFMPQVVLYGLAVVLTGVLQAHQRFLGPALAPLVSSVVVISAYLLYASTGRAEGLADLTRIQELLLSVGTTLGVAALALVLLLPLRRCGLRLRPTFGFPPAVGQRVRSLAAAGVAGLAAQQVALVVALRLAANDSAGSVVVFTVATALFLLPWAVLAVPVATSAFPRLAASAESGDEAAYADVARRALAAVVLVTAAAAALLPVVAVPVARLLVEGAPGTGSVEALSSALIAFAPGLLGYGVVALLSRALYARGRGRSAGAATVAGWAGVAVTDVVLVLLLPEVPVVVLLGVGNTAGLTLAAVLLVLALRRSGTVASVAGAGRTTATALAAAVLAVAVGLLVPGPDDPTLPVDVAVGAVRAVAALLVFAGVVRLLHPAAVREVAHALR